MYRIGSIAGSNRSISGTEAYVQTAETQISQLFDTNDFVRRTYHETGTGVCLAKFAITS